MVLGDGDVLRHGVAHFEAHRVFHLLLNTAAVGQDEPHVDSNQDKDDKNDDTGSNRVLTFHNFVLVLDVLPLVKFKAAFRLGGQVGANVFHDVLWRDVTTEGHPVDGD